MFNVVMIRLADRIKVHASTRTSDPAISAVGKDGWQLRLEFVLVHIEKNRNSARSTMENLKRRILRGFGKM